MDTRPQRYTSSETGKIIRPWIDYDESDSSSRSSSDTDTDDSENDYERSRSLSALAKAAGSDDNKADSVITLNSKLEAVSSLNNGVFYHDCRDLTKSFKLVCVLSEFFNHF